MPNPRKSLNGFDANNQPIINVPAPTNPSDAVNLVALQNAVNGLAWKGTPVRVATTTAGTLASSYANGQAVDGVTLATGDRVLVKNQANGAENGIYVVNASGAPTRATDADSAAKLNAAAVFVTQGSANKDTAYNQTTDLPITLGTTALVWAQIPASGVAYAAGSGLLLAGTTFSVLAKSGGGVVSDGTGVYIDPTYLGLAKRFSTTVPAGGTSTLLTHNLGTMDFVAETWDISGSSPVIVDGDIVPVSANTANFNTPTAVVANTLRVTLLG